jgi:hypothetical protein
MSDAIKVLDVRLSPVAAVGHGMIRGYADVKIGCVTIVGIAIIDYPAGIAMPSLVRAEGGHLVKKPMVRLSAACRKKVLDAVVLAWMDAWEQRGAFDRENAEAAAAWREAAKWA